MNFLGENRDQHRFIGHPNNGAKSGHDPFAYWITPVFMRLSFEIGAAAGAGAGLAF